MTGWRVGWLVLPEDLVRPVECLAQNLFISAPHISQVAAEAAFDCHDGAAGQCRALSPLARPPAARAAGGGVSAPVARPRARSTCSPISPTGSNDSVAFCARMLAEAGVAATPGRGFRPHARQPVRAVQLLRPGGGHARGGRAAEGLAIVGRTASGLRGRRLAGKRLMSDDTRIVSTLYVIIRILAIDIQFWQDHIICHMEMS